MQRKLCLVLIFLFLEPFFTTEEDLQKIQCLTIPITSKEIKEEEIFKSFV